jgi:UDP-GlcNAc3NAcA epimerase
MIVTIVGARPQFIKASVVSKALKDYGIEERIIHTGQHYDEKMSDVFWEELKIPNYDINLSVGSGTHAEQTAQMLVKIEQYLLVHQKYVHAVMVYGDTNSTLAGALAAAKLNIKIIHVESGLRSFNKSMPEEINRIVTDRISDIHFCSSSTAKEQLEREGVSEHVYDVGDVMYDALVQFSRLLHSSSVDKLLEGMQPFNLLTIHRPSNTDNSQNLKGIFKALEEEETNVV